MSALVDAVGWTLMLVGAVFALLTGLGLHRFHDSYARLHVAGKAATLGVVSTLVGAAFLLEDTPGRFTLLLAAVFILITSPAGAQALGGSATRGGTPTADDTIAVPLED